MSRLFDMASRWKVLEDGAVHLFFDVPETLIDQNNCMQPSYSCFFCHFPIVWLLNIVWSLFIQEHKSSATLPLFHTL